ncbi:MAG TPA: SIMPL domain-containing protein [Rhizomicrobium sp.]|nr:SIMPL domain-containing protein [Rhizomicrobium sp.]
MRFLSLPALALAAALCATPLAAVAADTPRTLSVSGTGEVGGAPDQAQVSAGVATVAVTANAAVAENARKMTAVFDALKRLGVPAKAIQTSNFQVQPQYSDTRGSDGAQRITGYQVSNQVDVTLDDTARLGAALDALVGAGANQINSVGFAVKDPAPLETAAREAAVADALRRGETFAHAAGVTLGPILSIQDGGSEAPRPMLKMMLAGRMADTTPTAAGELSVTANVSMVFEIH